MNSCFVINTNSWSEVFEKPLQEEAVRSLESGKILFFPNLKFIIKDEELELLNETDLAFKSIKYNDSNGKIWGVKNIDSKKEEKMKNLIQRYNQSAVNLVNNLLPVYKDNATVGNASLRTVPAEGRKQSKRQDDTKLHVDAFTTRPTHGKRLLRVFNNVNQNNIPRVWKAGEPFEDLAKKFLPRLPKYNKFIASFLQSTGLTKSFRTNYDHIMLKLHDTMKMDDEYQKTTPSQTIPFPAGSTWICYSDLVSHAVTSGKGLLEQTIYVNQDGLIMPNNSPLKILERLTSKTLI